MRLAVFASGGGSNFGAILDAVAAGRLPAEVVVLVADREGIGALARADAAGVSSIVLPPSAYPDATAFGEALLAALDAHGADFIALAGYLKKVPEAVVARFRHRMLNVHPALLPAFGGHGLYGRRVHEAVLAYGAKVSGATVHLVDAEYDTGPVVLQACVPVEDGDTPETLAARVLGQEHTLFPEALSLFAQGLVYVDGRVVRIRESGDLGIGESDGRNPAPTP
ncbi:MAG TPA: phosphoribosylglycinamide formyltransferase [Rhodothermales bacterium]|nr:phosphoribosylglycinamide formyltransferase [Rhodothermales bacterium]